MEAGTTIQFSVHFSFVSYQIYYYTHTHTHIYYITGYTYCLKYETDIQTNADSVGVIEVEIKFAESTLLFTLGERKYIGEEQRVCLGISSDSPPADIVPEQVRIRQSESTDAWGVKAIKIQQYPGSVDYSTYALESKEPRFWTDGDSNCPPYSPTNTLLCCINGEWCDMMRVVYSGK